MSSYLILSKQKHIQTQGDAHPENTWNTNIPVVGKALSSSICIVCFLSKIWTIHFKVINDATFNPFRKQNDSQNRIIVVKAYLLQEYPNRRKSMVYDRAWTNFKEHNFDECYTYVCSTKSVCWSRITYRALSLHSFQILPLATQIENQGKSAIRQKINK